MKYYLVKVTNLDNEQIECRAYTTRKEANYFSKGKTWWKCDKHFKKITDGDCSCRTYTTYLINEKLLDKKESHNV